MSDIVATLPCAGSKGGLTAVVELLVPTHTYGNGWMDGWMDIHRHLISTAQACLTLTQLVAAEAGSE